MPKRQPFKQLGDGVFKGKGVSSLLQSKDNRNSVIALFRGKENLPSSVMRAERPKKIKQEEDAATYERSYDKTCKLAKVQGDTAGHGKSMLKSALYISGRGCGAGALSTFPQNIGRSMVLMYSEPGQIVFDPFAGHNSRMDLVVKTGRHYIGCDLSAEFMKHNRQRAEQLKEAFPDAKIRLIEGDSRKIPVKDNLAHFTITSPPYYDIEYYGDEEHQLGKAPTYEQFLEGLQLVMHENYRVLKDGAYAIWFINDFRKKGKFYDYHNDVIRLGRTAGFVLNDILISDLGNGIRDCFINQTLKQRILPKRHEYGVVLRKISPD